LQTFCLTSIPTLGPRVARVDADLVGVTVLGA